MSYDGRAGTAAREMTRDERGRSCDQRLSNQAGEKSVSAPAIVSNGLIASDLTKAPAAGQSHRTCDHAP
jgi:hypothetical protein